MKNIFYFQSLNKIGGIEQFFYYLAQLYKDWDITILYESGDINQVMRLSQYVRVEQFHGTYECEKVFYCFNYSVRPYIHAQEENLVLHGDYEAMVKQGHLPKDCYIFNETFDNYYGVSPTVCKAWEGVTGKKCTLIWNPFIPPIPKKILRFVYCGRLTKEKGGDIARRFFECLDRHGVTYSVDVYSDQQIKGNHINNCGTRLDVDSYLTPHNYDFIIVPSYNEGYCYSLVQALSNGLAAIITPCPVFKDLGLNSSNSIQIEFDLSNVEKIIPLLDKEYKFTFTPPTDTWGKYLAKGKNPYKGRTKMKIRATQDYFDTFEQRNIVTGEEYDTPMDRARLIVNANFGVFVNDPVEDVEKPTKNVEKKKPTKKRG